MLPIFLAGRPDPQGLLFVVEAQSPQVAGAVHDADDYGLAVGDAEVDVVAPVYGESQSGPHAVARDAAVTQSGDPLEPRIQLGDEAPWRFLRTHTKQMRVDFVEVAQGVPRDYQIFFCDRATPRPTMSRVSSLASA
jgi:hypothetical protein